MGWPNVRIGRFGDLSSYQLGSRYVGVKKLHYYADLFLWATTLAHVLATASCIHKHSVLFGLTLAGSPPISYDTATAFRTNRTWNDETRRTISHRNKHSNSTCKIKRKREKYNRGNANDREYAEWLLAKKICEGVDVIYVEQLHLEAMSRRGGRHKRGMNRGMRFIRHGAILQKIRIVADRLGIRVVGVNPKYTSQECSVCGYTNKENRDGETFKCLKCDHMANADGNASVNIIQRGTGMKVPAGEGIVLERREMGRTRKPPVCAVPDARRRRENQACNRPKTSSVMKHLSMYAYVTYVQ